MNVSCQSIINIDRPNQGIIDLRDAGINRIFVPVHVKPFEPVKTERDNKELIEITRERYVSLIKKCGENNIQIAFLRISCAWSDAAGYDACSATEALAGECLALCKRAGCRMLLIESPFEIEKDEEQKNLMYECLVRIARQAYGYGVTLLLKNQVRLTGGHMVRGFCAEAGKAIMWLDRLNSELGYDAFGFCVDSGVCNICGTDTHTFIAELGKRIKLVILRDCDSKSNVAMLPFTCAGSGTDWLGLIRGLRDISFDGELAVDFSSTYSAFSPLLRPVLYKLVKETADYVKWQIEIEQNLKKYGKIVLFGAGNMCRAYIKCYGEKYPPIYACDNNPKLWDTTFEGLAVKNPKILQHLPTDCGVFICNIYYREIEEQLRAMGIENIEYFSDEYMPSFHYDRLEKKPGNCHTKR